MVRRRQRERSLFEMLLPDGHKLWPDWLRKIDTLLEDEAVIETVAQAMEARWPESRRRGRLGTPAEVVLRMLILKHLFDWSYDDLEREVRANLVYRAFTRIDAGEVPDAKTILKIARALGPEVIEELHGRVVDVAKRAGVTHGRRFRIDTTVVETNVHYPTDSSLLRDGMRVLTRTMQRASAALGDAPGRVRNRLRSVGRRVLIIGRQARSPETRERLGPQLSSVDGHDAGGHARCPDDGAPHQSAPPHRCRGDGVDLDPRAPALAADPPVGDARPRPDACAVARRRYPRAR
jgi:IS5 family transposase